MSGSSIGTIAGGIVGAIGGFFLGNPLMGASLGMTIGGGIGGVIDSPKAQKVQGPRVDDLSVQTATYGAEIPTIYGNNIVVGNVFWVYSGKIQEVSSSVKTGGKGMGGAAASTDSYTYYATFATGICRVDRDITVKIKRIWIGPNLIYNYDSTDVETIIANNKRTAEGGYEAFSFKIYDGNENQEADYWMQLDKGAANTPAYRGLCYIRILNLPLRDYGNSLIGAQVRVELCSDSVSYDTYTKIVENNSCGVNFNSWEILYPLPDAYTGVGFAYFVEANNGLLVVGIVDSTDEYVFNYSGNLLFQRTANEIPSTFNDSGGGEYNSYYCGGRLNGKLFWANPVNIASDFAILAYHNGLDYQNIQNADRLDLNLPGDRRIFGVILANDRNSVLVLMGGVGQVVYSGLNSVGGVWYILNSGGVIIDSGSIPDTSGYAGGGYNINTFGFRRGGPTTISIVNSTFDSNNSSIYSTMYVSGGEIIKHKINESNELVYDVHVGVTTVSAGVDRPSSIISEGDLVFIVVPRYTIAIFRATPSTDSVITVGDVIDSECVKPYLLTTTDIDTTEITDTVRGYRISQSGSIRSAIDPLRTIWPFDVVQHGYKIKFKKRGSTSVATIAISDLDARSAGDKPGIKITDSREMDSQLPSEVKIKYMDVNREYEMSEQVALRLNTNSINKSSYEFQVVMTADEAAVVASRLIYLYWMERHDVNFILPPIYQAVEPGDVIDIVSDTVTYNLRVTNINYLPDGRLECRAKYNNPALYMQVSKGQEGIVSTQQIISLPGATAYELLDIPLFRDSENTPGYLVAMTSYTAGWPGGVLYQSGDTGETKSAVLSAVSPGSTMGVVISGLLSPHEESTYDKSGLLTVRLYSGELFSITETQMFTGNNWFAYGVDGRWEIIAALNCVLQGDGSYIIYDFLRGQKGTEWASGLHQNNDYFIFLDAGLLSFIATNISSLNVSHLYRGITDGFTLDSDSDRWWSYHGVNLKPLAPCHLTGQRTALTNDWVVNWTRNSRFGNWVSYVDTQLGEQTETYEVEVYDSSYAIIKRTILVSSTSEITYTAAQQTADFGASQSMLFLKIYQISAILGRGYPLIASIQRDGGITYLRDWNDNLTTGQTLFGVSGAAQSASSGIFNLSSLSTSTDARSRLDNVPDVTNFDLTVDASINTSGSQTCVVFRTTYWSNTNDTFGYVVIISGTHITFGKGSNSSSGSWTPLASQAKTFSLGVFYKLRIRMIGNQINIWVNDILEINTVDSSYSLGQFAFRVFGATTSAQYDNLTILY